MKYILTIFLSLSFILSKAQNKHRIYLNNRIEDDKIKKSQAIVPVYKYVTTSIESFDMFGVQKKSDQKETLEIKKLPEMSRCRDTAYTYIFFSGANSDVNQGYLLTLVGNYRRSSRTVYFYIDRNNNLDFTDDGVPDSIPYGKTELEISLKNLQNADAEHHIRLSRIPYGKNMAYKSLLTDHFKKNSGTKIFTNINYCYREQRLNTKSGTFASGNDSFRIAIKDMNVSGLFHESCIDRFYIGGKEEAVYTDDMIEIMPQYEDTKFEWNKKQYQISAIDPVGQYVEIQEVEYPELKKKLKIGGRLDNFSFVNIENKRESLNDYKKREVYLFFWDRESLDSNQQLYLEKLQKEFSDALQVIALNHGDHPRKVRAFEFYNDIEWKIAYSNGFIARQFFLESVPNGFYIGKRCKLKAEDVSPGEMYEMMKGKSQE